MIEKMMPHDLEIESVILGALMLDQRSCLQFISNLLPEKFYDPKHEAIAEAIQSLYRSGKQIDIISVTKELRSLGKVDDAGGVMYVASLTNRVASTASMEQWILMLNEFAMRRSFIRIASEIHAKSFDLTIDIFDLYELFVNDMSSVFSSNVKQDGKHISMLTQSTIKSIEERAKSETGMSGLSSGIRSVDRKLGGHQKSDLMYLAGRPAMGKTAFALSEMLSMAEQGNPVAFFSLEMSSDQLVYRLASMICHIPAEILMKYRLDPHQSSNYYQAIDRLHALPIFIDDTASLSVFDLRAKLKRLKEKHGVKAAFIDYIQLMSIGSNRKSSLNREQELSTISRTLKLIAKECDIPLIVLSQLSRSVESRTDKRPLLSDLRESGSLEQDADIVSFLFRPEYYGIREDDRGNSTIGLGEYIIAKQRNGATGICEMKFDHKLMRYTDPDQPNHDHF